MSLIRAVEIEEPTSALPRKKGWLPFSGWHLLLMPVALLFALPPCSNGAHIVYD